ncbi:MAG: MFS transporter [Desulfomonile tiedjei]|nr:MFS transporter [Desulfomonile tiedjei]
MTSLQENKFNLKILLILSLGHLVTDIYQGSLPALLPLLKEKLLLSYTMTGVIMMAANLTSSVVQPVFGYLSDKKEKIFLLPLGCLCAGIGFSLVGLPDEYAIVLALVMVSGLGVAAFHPEGYKTARFFTGDKMATGMSVFSVGGNLGFAVGPIISLAIVTRLGFDYLPAMIVLSLVFVALVSYAWGSVASPKQGTLEKAMSSEGATRGVYLSLFLIIATVIMRSWTQIGLMTYIPFYYIDVLKGDPLYAAQLVSVFLIGGVVGTIGGSIIADRVGHKRYLIASLLLATVLFPLIFITEGLMLFVALGVVGMVLISSFTVTIVMAQELLPRNLGIASGLMVGFAIGTGGIGVTILGVIADHYGVPVALKSIWLLPLAGLLLSLPIRYRTPRRS